MYQQGEKGGRGDVGAGRPPSGKQDETGRAHSQWCKQRQFPGSWLRPGPCDSPPLVVSLVEITAIARSHKDLQDNVATACLGETENCVPILQLSETKDVVVRLLASHFDKPGSIIARNVTGRCCWPAGFLGELPFPPPVHSGAAPYLISPSLALKTSMFGAAQISRLTLRKNVLEQPTPSRAIKGAVYIVAIHDTRATVAMLQFLARSVSYTARNMRRQVVPISLHAHQPHVGVEHTLYVLTGAGALDALGFVALISPAFLDVEHVQVDGALKPLQATLLFLKSVVGGGVLVLVGTVEGESE
ncbi:hypothetical protein PR048_022634 [Dryococelus australis]|uniref:Uncharacterized protein n=1 Tax=Dryococelus australis TaxID=614101 RepID=A0ABQ9H1M8_9NEOP|nr:hypothetical protein PR048_022634 [Dryococelus australis]